MLYNEKNGHWPLLRPKLGTGNVTVRSDTDSSEGSPEKAAVVEPASAVREVRE